MKQFPLTIFFIFVTLNFIGAQNFSPAFQNPEWSIFYKNDELGAFYKTNSGETENLVYIDFVGSGDIQKSASNGNDINANTGIGVIFERYNSMYKPLQSFELEATLNIASTSDSVKALLNNNVIQNSRDFGTYIINPISTKQSIYINSNLYFGAADDEKMLGFIARHIVNGVNVRLVTSNSVWEYDSTTSNLGALAFRAGVFHEFIPDNYRVGKVGSDDEGRSKYSIYLGINYSYRGILGDILSEQNTEFRQSILGSEQTKFKGFELNFGFRLNNLRAEFQMPILNIENNSIDGLTNAQFLFSIKFVGGFSLKLDKDESTNNDTPLPLKEDDSDKKD